MIYKDTTQPLEKRVTDLLERMTLDEKVAQLCCILPNMLIGKKSPDPKLLDEFMHDGLGRMTQFCMFF
jgi:beta-glucosidase